MVKLVVQKQIWNIVCALQAGSELSEKAAFWNDFKMLTQETPPNVIGADMNRHVGETKVGFEGCYGGFGYRTVNDEEEELLNFAKFYGLTLLNIMFKKQDEQLITYSSGGNKT